MSELKIDRTIDARGSACPGPLMELIKGVKSAGVGTVIELLSCEKGTTVDAPAWIKKVGQEFIDMEEKEGYWRIVMKKIK
ncbi:MAG: sulfurtransferase TusA family protein [Nitrospiraceae bacterium]|nr:MAG: sulfurtransferase TusA family protein [Nitrospiraceae bacterium]